jgi:hypothetical protein
MCRGQAKPHLFSRQLLGRASDVNLDDRLASLVQDLERVVLTAATSVTTSFATEYRHVALDVRILEVTAQEALGIEDGVFGLFATSAPQSRNVAAYILGCLILCRVAYEPLSGVWGEADVGRGNAVALVVGQDFDGALSLDATRRSVRLAVQKWQQVTRHKLGEVRYRQALRRAGLLTIRGPEIDTDDGAILSKQIQVASEERRVKMNLAQKVSAQASAARSGAHLFVLCVNATDAAEQQDGKGHKGKGGKDGGQIA